MNRGTHGEIINGVSSHTTRNIESSSSRARTRAQTDVKIENLGRQASMRRAQMEAQLDEAEAEH
jgi:hypothetical protein